jgi:hypothetical protein
MSKLKKKNKQPHVASYKVRRHKIVIAYRSAFKMFGRKVYGNFCSVHTVQNLKELHHYYSLRLLPNLKKKVKLSVCLINWALLQEEAGMSGGVAPPFLTLALDGGEWTDSHLGRFDPREIALVTHWIGDCVGP